MLMVITVSNICKNNIVLCHLEISHFIGLIAIAIKIAYYLRMHVHMHMQNS